MWWNRIARRQSPDIPAKATLALALEARMMFDGAIAATLAETADSQPAATVASEDATSDTAATPPSATTDHRQEVVFIDSQVQDHQQLLDSLPPGTEVLVLDAGQDGLRQIASYLEGRSGIDAIHILSHGDIGRLQLGSQWLDNGSLPANAELLNSIGQALTADGDILLYGCQVGANGAGADFLQALATATGADIAASDDLTGAAGKGGDWLLETSQGLIEAASLAGFGAYEGLLAAPSSENFDGVPLNDGGGLYSWGDSPRVINGWTIRLLDAVGNDAPGEGTSQPSYIDVTQDAAGTALAGPGDSALHLNGWVGVVQAAQFKATSGDEFWLQSFEIENATNTSALRVVGYRDGVIVATQDFTETTQDGSGRLVTLEHSLDQDWQNIDEFRIVQPDGSADILFYIDDIIVAPAVLPSVAPSLSATAVNPTFTENGSAVDLFSGVTADTNDTGQSFTGATFTVTNVSNGASEILTIGGTDIALNNGNNGAIPGIGNYSVSVTGNTATVTLSGMSRDNAQMASLIDAITYRNTSDNPGDNSRVVTITSITDSGSGNNTATPDLVSTVAVTPVNDAPVLTPTSPTLDGLTDSEVNSVGQAVSSFAGANISDVDSDAVKGIAIIGLASGNGTWQYSVDGGASWQDVGSVSGSAALLLRSTDRVRFVPDGINGTTANITYRAWDQSGATNGQQGTKVDASVTGGTSPFSWATDTASLTVTAVNDAPIVTTSGGAAAFVEGDNVASTPVVVDAGITVVDSDSPLLHGATVQISGNFQSTEDLLSFIGNPATMGDITGIYDASTGILTLTSAAGATAAQWQAALRAVTYSNDSDNPVTADRTISFVVDDGSASSAAAERIVTVTSTNDAPIVTVPGSIGVLEDVASAITGISFADADAGAGSVTVTLSVPSGTLSATSGGGVTIGGTTSALTLVGSISDINAFIAGGHVSYQTALDSTASVTLTASISDNGLSGGPPKSDSDTVLITVTAVNDAPTITAPGSVAVTEDVPTPLTGISFSDVDVGASPVTVTLLVPSGSLSATSANGVTVGGSASNMTLIGSLSDINAFIASGGVTFITASNATSDVTLTIEINDNGNTGSGGAKSDSTTVTLDVSAVNDAPVNSLPGPQNVDQDASLVFSSGNGNLISISDVDAGSSHVQVTLIASNGLLTLGSTTGLSFTSGNGAADSSMTFTGSISDINAALNGLTFSPTAGYNGAASLQITTDDLGASGSGGAQTSTDTLLITVNSLNPRITDVSASSSDGSYKVGDTITITATFNQVVTVDTSGGVPTLLLETGLIDRNATYVSGSGSNTLTFSYTVQAGDLSADLDYQSTAALSLNGSTIRGATANDAVLTLPTPGAAGSLGANKALVIDGVRPTATSITLSDTALSIGETATVTVTFNERVSGLTIADFTVANGSLSSLSSSDGGLTWTATFTPDAGISDTTNLITLDNTGVQDLAGNVGSGTTDSGNYAIDTLRPTASIVVTDTVLKAGQSTTVTITFSEAVTGLTTADFLVPNGSLSNLATSDNITYTAILTPDANVTDASNLITLNTSGVQDTAGNAGAGTIDSNNYAIDTQRPTAAIVVTDTVLRAGQSTTVTITFSEAVSGLTTTDFSVANGALSNLSSSDGGLTWTATLTPSINVTDSSNLITLDNTGYTDAAGNTGTSTTNSNNYAIDSKAPAVTSVGVPANGTYVAGNNLDFTVNFDEAVTVDTSGGAPRLAITLDTGGTVYADYIGGSGGTALVFRLTVANDQQDTNGIVVGASIDANGATLRDAAGNNALTALNGMGSTTGVLVDSVAPQVTDIALDGASPTRNTTVSFTVTFNEAVVGVDLADFALTTSGSASGTLLSLIQLDARTYRVTVGAVTGQGTLGLSLAAAGSGITDTVGHALADDFVTVGYVLGGVEGDPEFRANPTPSVPITPTAPIQPDVPSAPPPLTTSPLLPPPLFEQPTLGSGVPTLGNIFINNGALAPSYIAQVFASSNSGAGNGSGIGFLGFGGGDGGVFGTSSFSSMFGKDVPLEPEGIQLRWGASAGTGGDEIFGAPTLGQQLQEMGQNEHRQIRDLAWALGQVQLQTPQA